MNKLTGAQIVIESLLAEGVDTVFGYPGGAILPTYDALLDTKINHVLVRHEQGATHMAEGYARVSGRPGVVIVTSGPRCDQCRYRDCRCLYGFDAHGRYLRPGSDHTDWQRCVPGSGLRRDHASLHEAQLSGEGLGGRRTHHQRSLLYRQYRPVPVRAVVDVPRDVQQAKHSFHYPDHVELRGFKPTIRGNPRQIERAIEAIEQSEKPLFYVGGGVQWSGAAAELTQLVRGLGIPVTETLMGFGSVPASDSLCLGMLGMHGSYGTNTAVCNTDCLVAIGARFDDRVTGRIADFAPNAKTIIHIDIDPSSISRTLRWISPLLVISRACSQKCSLVVRSRESFGQRKAAWSKWHNQDSRVEARAPALRK